MLKESLRQVMDWDMSMSDSLRSSNLGHTAWAQASLAKAAAERYHANFLPSSRACEASVAIHNNEAAGLIRSTIDPKHTHLTAALRVYVVLKKTLS